MCVDHVFARTLKCSILGKRMHLNWSTLWVKRYYIIIKILPRLHSEWEGDLERDLEESLFRKRPKKVLERCSRLLPSSSLSVSFLFCFFSSSVTKAGTNLNMNISKMFLEHILAGLQVGVWQKTQKYIYHDLFQPIKPTWHSHMTSCSAYWRTRAAESDEQRRFPAFPSAPSWLSPIILSIAPDRGVLQQFCGSSAHRPQRLWMTLVISGIWMKLGLSGAADVARFGS